MSRSLVEFYKEIMVLKLMQSNPVDPYMNYSESAFF
jgi:hypothetical protein